MAKKKRASIAGVLVEAVSDIANAASVAATGSEIGVLELAAEDELKLPQTKRARLDRRNRRKAYSSSDKRRSNDRWSTSKKCSKPRQSDGFGFNRHLPQSRRSSCRTLRECLDKKKAADYNEAARIDPDCTWVGR